MARKVIFDTDPGVDDATALLLLHSRPEIELVGITTTFGNADIAGTTRNALYLKSRFGIAAPVARGAAFALNGTRGNPPVMVHGANGLGDIALDDAAPGEVDPRSAPQFIIDMVRRHPGEITVLAVGRMTNLAMAINVAPDIVPLVRQVVIMGGAFGFAGSNGNVTPVAEANISGDPEAADIVFGAAWPVVAIGLDVTRQVIVSPAEIEMLANSRSEAAQFVAAISRHYVAYYRRVGIEGFFVHDSSAAAYVIDPDLFTLRSGAIRVATSGIAQGQTVLRDVEMWYPPGAWDDRPVQNAAAAVRAGDVKDLLLSQLLRC